MDAACGVGVSKPSRAAPWWPHGTQLAAHRPSRAPSQAAKSSQASHARCTICTQSTTSAVNLVSSCLIIASQAQQEQHFGRSPDPVV
eukprot:3825560-Rhodomonas_salina.2